MPLNISTNTFVDDHYCQARVGMPYLIEVYQVFTHFCTFKRFVENEIGWKIHYIRYEGEENPFQMCSHPRNHIRLLSHATKIPLHGRNESSADFYM